MSVVIDLPGMQAQPGVTLSVEQMQQQMQQMQQMQEQMQQMQQQMQQMQQQQTNPGEALSISQIQNQQPPMQYGMDGGSTAGFTATPSPGMTAAMVRAPAKTRWAVYFVRLIVFALLWYVFSILLWLLVTINGSYLTDFANNTIAVIPTFLPWMYLQGVVVAALDKSGILPMKGEDRAGNKWEMRIWFKRLERRY